MKDKLKLAMAAIRAERRAKAIKEMEESRKLGDVTAGYEPEESFLDTISVVDLAALMAPFIAAGMKHSDALAKARETHRAASREIAAHNASKEPLPPEAGVWLTWPQILARLGVKTRRAVRHLVRNGIETEGWAESRGFSGPSDLEDFFFTAKNDNEEVAPASLIDELQILKSIVLLARGRSAAVAKRNKRLATGGKKKDVRN